MTLSKKERVIRTLELDDNIDMLPVHYLGFEKFSSSYQRYCADLMGASIFNRNDTHVRSFNRSITLLESISSWSRKSGRK